MFPGEGGANLDQERKRFFFSAHTSCGFTRFYINLKNFFYQSVYFNTFIIRLFKGFQHFLNISVASVEVLLRMLAFPLPFLKNR